MTEYKRLRQLATDLIDDFDQVLKQKERNIQHWTAKIECLEKEVDASNLSSSEKNDIALLVLREIRKRDKK